jgi:hypothetical protein
MTKPPGPVLGLLSSRQIAKQFGISRSKLWRAKKVADIPEAEFEAMIEGPNPPTVTALVKYAQKGAKPTSYDRLVKAWNAASDDDRERLLVAISGMTQPHTLPTYTACHCPPRAPLTQGSEANQGAIGQSRQRGPSWERQPCARGRCPPFPTPPPTVAPQAATSPSRGIPGQKTQGTVKTLFSIAPRARAPFLHIPKFENCGFVVIGGGRGSAV